MGRVAVFNMDDVKQVQLVGACVVVAEEQNK